MGNAVERDNVYPYCINFSTFTNILYKACYMRSLFIVGLLLAFQCCIGQELYQVPKGVQSKVSSFENKNGRKGEGGRTNKGAKGNAFEELYPGDSKELLSIQGQGIIQRI